MASGFEEEDRGRRAGEEPLLGIDSELNIFALANGVDLLRNVSDDPDRILEWYREGMERRIVIRASGSGRYAITVSASRGRGGEARMTTRSLAEITAADLRNDLRQFLSDGIERANELNEDDLPSQD